LCDVYDGAMISVTLLFAAVPKIIIFSVIVKIFLLIFYDFASFWSSFFLFSSLLSIAVGSLSAIYQKRLKRLFAYSTVAHTGFILLGVVAASPDSVKTLIFLSNDLLRFNHPIVFVIDFCYNFNCSLSWLFS